MVRDNGLDPRDPDYDNYGFSDFLSDYSPEDDQIEEWFEDDAAGAVKEIVSYSNGIGILRAAWVATHEDEIEKEWDGRGDTE